MRRIGVLGAVSLLLVFGVVACSSGSQSSPGQRLDVFAAASLKSVFTELADQFKTDNPGVTVDFSFSGSSDLATQLTQGASADVFASADTAQMNVVAKAGLLAADPQNFAS